MIDIRAEAAIEGHINGNYEPKRAGQASSKISFFDLKYASTVLSCQKIIQALHLKVEQVAIVENTNINFVHTLIIK